MFGSRARPLLAEPLARRSRIESVQIDRHTLQRRASRALRDEEGTRRRTRFATASSLQRYSAQ